MTHEKEKLPWDMIEEILSRVPPKYLVRFRTVCKRWNNIFNYKRFINNHKTTFHFVLTTKSKIYSVNVLNPKIVDVRELTLEIPGLDESQIPRKLIDCNEFLLCTINKGAAVWNPWLRQSTLIEPGLNQYLKRFHGIGYDNNRSYKLIGSRTRSWNIYDFASDACKGIKSGSTDDDVTHCSLTHTRVFLNGTLYWVASSDKIEDDNLFVIGFDFSKEDFFEFCDLPCRKINHDRDALVLGVYKGNRFSWLKQCYATKKIEIWVTKDKINNHCNGKDVPSYFIDDDKRLVMCSCDETGRVCIYVVREIKLISKLQINAVTDLWPKHCTSNPSLVMVPSVLREQRELQV